MRNTLLAASLLLQAASPLGQSLDLPPRPGAAPGGKEFASSIEELPLERREGRILEAVLAGNVPAFLRTLVPVTAAEGTDRATYFVTPDYLAIGSDGDYFLTPMTPYTAQRIADRLDCTLPTPRMVDAIYGQARGEANALAHPAVARDDDRARLPPASRDSARPAPGRAARRPGHRAQEGRRHREHGPRRAGKVAIYGWHRPDGRPIQPLYAGHAASWVD
jgi:hypothetical protein